MLVDTLKIGLELETRNALASFKTFKGTVDGTKLTPTVDVSGAVTVAQRYLDSNPLKPKVDFTAAKNSWKVFRAAMRGAANVELKVDTKDAIAKIALLENIVVNLKVDLDAAALATAKAAIASLADNIVKIKLQVDAAGLEVIEQRIAAISGARMQLGVDVDNAQLTALVAQLSAMPDGKMTTGLDASAAIAELGRFKTELAEVKDQTVKIAVEDTAAIAQLATLKTDLAEVKDQTIKIALDNTVGAGIAAIKAELKAIELDPVQVRFKGFEAAELSARQVGAELKKLTSAIDISIRAGGADAMVATYEAAFDKLNNRAFEVKVSAKQEASLDSAFQKLGELRSLTESAMRLEVEAAPSPSVHGLIDDLQSVRNLTIKASVDQSSLTGSISTIKDAIAGAKFLASVKVNPENLAEVKSAIVQTQAELTSQQRVVTQKRKDAKELEREEKERIKRVALAERFENSKTLAEYKKLAKELNITPTTGRNKADYEAMLRSFLIATDKTMDAAEDAAGRVADAWEITGRKFSNVQDKMQAKAEYVGNAIFEAENHGAADAVLYAWQRTGRGFEKIQNSMADEAQEAGVRIAAALKRASELGEIEVGVNTTEATSDLRKFLAGMKQAIADENARLKIQVAKESTEEGGVSAQTTAELKRLKETRREVADTAVAYGELVRSQKAANAEESEMADLAERGAKLSQKNVDFAISENKRLEKEFNKNLQANMDGQEKLDKRYQKSNDLKSAETKRLEKEQQKSTDFAISENKRLETEFNKNLQANMDGQEKLDKQYKKSNDLKISENKRLETEFNKNLQANMDGQEKLDKQYQKSNDLKSAETKRLETEFNKTLQSNIAAAKSADDKIAADRQKSQNQYEKDLNTHLAKVADDERRVAAERDKARAKSDRDNATMTQKILVDTSDIAAAKDKLDRLVRDEARIRLYADLDTSEVKEALRKIEDKKLTINAEIKTLERNGGGGPGGPGMMGAMGSVASGFAGAAAAAGKIYEIARDTVEVYGRVGTVLAGVVKNSLDEYAAIESSAKTASAILNGDAKTQSDLYDKIFSTSLSSGNLYGGKEIGAAAETLARAGQSADQIGNSLEKIAVGATASKADLNKFALAYSDFSNKFTDDNLRPSEQLKDNSKFIDIMTRSLTSASISTEQFSKSIQYINPLKRGSEAAKEAVIEITALARVGARGSKSATNLNNAYKTMTKGLGGTSKDAEKKRAILESLSVTADGTAKSLSSMLTTEDGKEMKDYTQAIPLLAQAYTESVKKIGQVKSIAMFSELLGTQGFNTLNNAIALSRKEMDLLSKSFGDLSKEDFSAQFAERMKAGLGGAMVQMTNAIDSGKTAIGKALAPVATAIALTTTQVITNALSMGGGSLGKLLKEVQDKFTAFGSNSAMVEKLSTAFNRLGISIGTKLLTYLDQLITYLSDEQNLTKLTDGITFWINASIDAFVTLTKLFVDIGIAGAEIGAMFEKLGGGSNSGMATIKTGLEADLSNQMAMVTAYEKKSKSLKDDLEFFRDRRDTGEGFGVGTEAAKAVIEYKKVNDELAIVNSHLAKAKAKQEEYNSKIKEQAATATAKMSVGERMDKDSSAPYKDQTANKVMGGMTGMNFGSMAKDFERASKDIGQAMQDMMRDLGPETMLIISQVGSVIGSLARILGTALVTAIRGATIVFKPLLQGLAGLGQVLVVAAKAVEKFLNFFGDNFNRTLASAQKSIGDFTNKIGMGGDFGKGLVLAQKGLAAIFGGYKGDTGKTAEQMEKALVEPARKTALAIGKFADESDDKQLTSLSSQLSTAVSKGKGISAAYAQTYRAIVKARDEAAQGGDTAKVARLNQIEEVMRAEIKATEQSVTNDQRKTQSNNDWLAGARKANQGWQADVQQVTADAEASINQWAVDAQSAVMGWQTQAVAANQGWQADVQQVTAGAGASINQWAVDAQSAVIGWQTQAVAANQGWQADVQQVTADAGASINQWAVDAQSAVMGWQTQAVAANQGWQADVQQVTAGAGASIQGWAVDAQSAVMGWQTQAVAANQGWQADVQQVTAGAGASIQGWAVGAGEAVANWAVGAISNVQSWLAGVGQAVDGAIQAFQRWAGEVGAQAQRAAQGALNAMITGFQGMIQAAQRTAQAIGQGLLTGVQNAARDIQTALVDAFVAAQTAVGNIATAIANLVPNMGGVVEGLQGIAGQVANIGAGAASGVQRLFGYARGGVLPGYSSVDDQIIMARSGEGIIVPEAVKALGGAQGVERLNRMSERGGIPGFASGGVVKAANTAPVDAVRAAMIEASVQRGKSEAIRAATVKAIKAAEVEAAKVAERQRGEAAEAKAAAAKAAKKQTEKSPPATPAKVEVTVKAAKVAGGTLTENTLVSILETLTKLYDTVSKVIADLRSNTLKIGQLASTIGNTQINIPEVVNAVVSSAPVQAAVKTIAQSKAYDAASARKLFDGGSDSLIAKVIGMAEGNRKSDGSYTKYAKGHTDPGNAASNIGSFSAQGIYNDGTIAGSDKLVMDRLLKPAIEKLMAAAKAAGIQVTSKVLFNYLDLMNQAPDAATGWNNGKGFLGGLGSLKGKENDDQAIKVLRREGFRNKGGRLETTFKSQGLLDKDQERRMAEINAAIAAFKKQLPDTITTTVKAATAAVQEVGTNMASTLDGLVNKIDPRFQATIRGILAGKITEVTGELAEIIQEMGNQAGSVTAGVAAKFQSFATGTLAAQEYLASRPGRKHAGQDFDLGDNDSFQSYIGGQVTRVTDDPGGYYKYIDIYNDRLKRVERIAELDNLIVKVGDMVKSGQTVGSGTKTTGVVHYEIRNDISNEKQGDMGSTGTEDPIAYLEKLGIIKRTGGKVNPTGKSNVGVYDGNKKIKVDRDKMISSLQSMVNSTAGVARAERQINSLETEAVYSDAIAALDKQKADIISNKDSFKDSARIDRLKDELAKAERELEFDTDDQAKKLELFKSNQKAALDRLLNAKKPNQQNIDNLKKSQALALEGRLRENDRALEKNRARIATAKDSLANQLTVDGFDGAKENVVAIEALKKQIRNKELNAEQMKAALDRLGIAQTNAGFAIVKALGDGNSAAEKAAKAQARTLGAIEVLFRGQGVVLSEAIAQSLDLEFSAFQQEQASRLDKATSEQLSFLYSKGLLKTGSITGSYIRNAPGPENDPYNTYKRLPDNIRDRDRNLQRLILSESQNLELKRTISDLQVKTPGYINRSKVGVGKSVTTLEDVTFNSGSEILADIARSNAKVAKATTGMETIAKINDSHNKDDGGDHSGHDHGEAIAKPQLTPAVERISQSITSQYMSTQTTPNIIDIKLPTGDLGQMNDQQVRAIFEQVATAVNDPAFLRNILPMILQMLRSSPQARQYMGF